MIRFARCLILLSTVVVLAGCGRESIPDPDNGAAARPNILLIVADDMGFSDLGSFGGEIDTPNLDRLAHDGIRFTNFHASTMCSPSRAMLLTGVDSHLAGYGNMLEELAPNQKGKPGYEGYLNDRVVTLPTILQTAGYQTIMTGKWHLGSGEGRGPAWRGFDHSFALDSGGASHFGDMRPAYAPTPDVKANYSEDGRKLESLPAGFEYSSQYYVDRMIEFLDESDDDRPFFAYLSFTAPHWPLQAPDAAIDRHRGRYDEGYDRIAADRLQRLKQLGMIPDHAGQSGRSPKERPWENLGEQERKVEVRAMEIYAAMIDEMDRHTGRLFDFLERTGRLDDTLVLFLSDNGPEGHDLDETWPMEAFPDIRKTIDAAHDFSYEAMGRPGSYVLYGPNWANAGSPAFRLHKAFPTEGGSRVAAFAWNPGLTGPAGITDDFVYVTDVMPTILKLAGVDDPGGEFEGREVESGTGVSFLPLLQGNGPEGGERVVAQELVGKRVVRSGPWKLVHMPAPYGINDWQLFNLDEDLGESNDVAALNPDVVARLVKAWDEYAETNGVIIPDWVSGY
jgi:arylsulfatase